MKKHESSVQEQLRKILKNYHLENPYIEYEVKKNWAKLLPKQIAKISKPEKIENNTLTIRVNDELWKKEINSRKNELLDMINRSFNAAPIKKLKIV